jgi:hypothetical protein
MRSMSERPVLVCTAVHSHLMDGAAADYDD